MGGTTNLTDGERILLATLMEPFVFMPDGLLEPLPAERMAAIWRAAFEPDSAPHPELV